MGSTACFRPPLAFWCGALRDKIANGTWSLVAKLYEDLLTIPEGVVFWPWLRDAARLGRDLGQAAFPVKCTQCAWSQAAGKMTAQECQSRKSRFAGVATSHNLQHLHPEDEHLAAFAICQHSEGMHVRAGAFQCLMPLIRGTRFRATLCLSICVCSQGVGGCLELMLSVLHKGLAHGPTAEQRTPRFLYYFNVPNCACKTRACLCR